jgi:hypothetical protein
LLAPEASSSSSLLHLLSITTGAIFLSQFFFQPSPALLLSPCALSSDLKMRNKNKNVSSFIFPQKKNFKHAKKADRQNQQWGRIVIIIIILIIIIEIVTLLAERRD